MNRLIIASNNKGKISEIKQIFEGVFDEICGMSDIGIHTEVVEDGETFLDNAVKKAVGICRECGLPCLADDSGLCVDALDGAPGVYSARYSMHGDDDANMDKLLENLTNVPAAERTARFVSVVALAMPDGRVFHAEGSCDGSIGFEKRCKHGFGYDPLFISDEYNKTFAEITPEQKNAVSHRRRALNALREVLGDIL